MRRLLLDDLSSWVAWMIDHDIASYKLVARSFAGRSEGLTRDGILDNATLYSLTHTVRRPEVPA